MVSSSFKVKTVVGVFFRGKGAMMFFLMMCYSHVNQKVTFHFQKMLELLSVQVLLVMMLSSPLTILAGAIYENTKFLSTARQFLLNFLLSSNSILLTQSVLKTNDAYPV